MLVDNDHSYSRGGVHSRDFWWIDKMKTSLRSLTRKKRWKYSEMSRPTQSSGCRCPMKKCWGDSGPESITHVSEVFIAATKQGGDYVSLRCHCRMYWQTVQQFNISQWSKAPKEAFLPKFMHTSVKRNIWICKTCDRALKQGKIPAQA